MKYNAIDIQTPQCLYHQKLHREHFNGTEMVDSKRLIVAKIAKSVMKIPTNELKIGGNKKAKRQSFVCWDFCLETNQCKTRPH